MADAAYPDLQSASRPSRKRASRPSARLHWYQVAQSVAELVAERSDARGAVVVPVPARYQEADRLLPVATAEQLGELGLPARLIQEAQSRLGVLVLQAKWNLGAKRLGVVRSAVVHRGQ